MLIIIRICLQSFNIISVIILPVLFMIGSIMKVATFNINSIKAHAVSFFEWLKEYNPDIVFLQEIKCETENFLYFECESLGYQVAALGQKSYNGVAVLSKYPFTVTAKNLPDFPDDAARYLEVLINSPKGQFYAAALYVPNGCSPDRNVEKEKLQYKLNWLDKLYQRVQRLMNTGHPIILGGDFNIMMSEVDVFDPNRFKDSPLYIKPVQDKLRALQYAGLHDAFRILHPKIEGFTFWDYTANSFVTNSGLRIDYLLISAQFAEQLRKCYADKSLRMKDKPSDHTALVAEFED